MSEQRRMRSETRQGLHQFLMRLYVSYLETMGEDEAKAIVREVIQEEFARFSPDTIAEVSAKQVLTLKIQELTTKMESSPGFDTQLWYAEKIDALNAALEALSLPTNN